MADDDVNFDIDIYGDDDQDNIDYQNEHSHNDIGPPGEALAGGNDEQDQEPYSEDIDIKLEHPNPTQLETHDNGNYEAQVSTGPTSTQDTSPTQGTKRKEDFDDWELEHGAQAAIVVSELNWWTNDDDIRGWANQCGIENELTTITFHEHKVNGKSKGEVYIEFASPKASSMVKSYVNNLSFGPGTKKHTVDYHSPSSNPFKVLTKDASVRGGGSVAGRGGATASAYDRPGGSQFADRGGFRGRGRGGMNNYNRGNFAGGQGNNMGGAMGGGFNGGMSMGGYNNFRGGGNMMGGGMRGGRGGFNNFNRGGGMMQGMGGMPMQMGNMSQMGNMGQMGGMGGMGQMGNQMGNMANQMANMGNPMAMNMGGMGGGFQGGQGHFNPAFFQNQQMGGGGGGGDNNYMNQHGAKRARQE